WDSGNNFTVKSVYSLIRIRGVKDVVTPAVWKLKIPTKIKIFRWLSLKKRLPTVDNLIKRGRLVRKQHMHLMCRYFRICGPSVGGIFLFISLLDVPHALTFMEDVNTVWEALAGMGAQGDTALTSILVATIW
ncbi:hypothetical protein ACMD2_14954, partial [Ananas comosus]